MLPANGSQCVFLNELGRLTVVLHESTQVRACVLYVDPSTRLVGLSLRSFLVHPGTTIDHTPAGGERIGEVVKDCKITAMHNRSGGMVEMPDATVAFVHVSPSDVLNIKACFDY